MFGQKQQLESMDTSFIFLWDKLLLQGQAILRQQSSSMCAKLNVIAKCQEFRQKKETLIQKLNAFKARNQHQLHWMKIYICLGLYPRDEFRKPEETILYNIYQPCHHYRKGERFMCARLIVVFQMGCQKKLLWGTIRFWKVGRERCEKVNEVPSGH